MRHAARFCEVLEAYLDAQKDGPSRTQETDCPPIIPHAKSFHTRIKHLKWCKLRERPIDA